MHDRVVVPRSGPDAVAHERLIEDRTSKPEVECAQPEVDVFICRESVVEPPDAIPELALEHRRDVPTRAAPDRICHRVRRGFPTVRRSPERLQCTADEAQVLPLAEQLRRPLEVRRLEQVVTVQEHRERRSRGGDPGVTRMRGTAMLGADDLDRRRVGLDASQYMLGERLTDPSSTTMTSSGTRVWAKTLSIASGKVRPSS